jgi:hypothetical protein
MDVLVAYGLGSDESDNNRVQQQKEKQASGKKEIMEIPGLFYI